MVQSQPSLQSFAEPIAVDFLNSVRRSNDRLIDRLDTGEALLSWLEQARLVPAAVLAVIRAETPSRELNEIAAQARNLREWFRTFVRVHWGRVLQDDDLEVLTPLNALLERDEAFCQLVEADSKVTGLDLQVRRRWGSPETLLVAIAQALATFIILSGIGPRDDAGLSCVAWKTSTR
jgi:predicted RNA-binding Zn ribbon-like protein